MTASVLPIVLWRCLMVALFLPLSAIDKVFNFAGATRQAATVFRPRLLARATIVAGLAIEAGCGLGIITGVADRLAALVLALYCAATAVLFKPFWAPGDFWTDGEGKARGLFWDFFKNLALGAALLTLTLGANGHGWAAFLADPFGSTHPYAQDDTHG